MKHEWKKHEKDLYGAKQTPAMITMPMQSYIMINGKGKRKRETSLEYLIEQTHFEAYSTDHYFICFDTPTNFTVHGQLVTVDNERLANALLCLPEKRREIILLHYYLHFSDVQIAALYGSPRTTVNYQRQAALKQLRKEMEGMKDEIETDILRNH